MLLSPAGSEGGKHGTDAWKLLKFELTQISIVVKHDLAVYLYQPWTHGSLLISTSKPGDSCVCFTTGLHSSPIVF